MAKTLSFDCSLPYSHSSMFSFSYVCILCSCSFLFHFPFEHTKIKQKRECDLQNGNFKSREEIVGVIYVAGYKLLNGFNNLSPF